MPRQSELLDENTRSGEVPSQQTTLPAGSNPTQGSYLEHTRRTLNDHLLPFKIHSELDSTRMRACIRLYVIVGP